VNPLKEKWVGCLMVLGMVMCACGGGFAMIFSMGGVFRGTYTREAVTDRITDAGTLNWAPAAFSFAGVGVFICLGALGYGLYYSNRGSLKGPRQVIENAKVLSRYAVTKENVYLTDPVDLDYHEGLVYCVQLQINQYDKFEYRCSPEVFWQCGEGMFGEAEIQGKWIGRFTPYIGRPGSVLPT